MMHYCVLPHQTSQRNKRPRLDGRETMMHYYGSTAGSHKRIVIVIVNDESWK
jgi:hypothetical protein